MAACALALTLSLEAPGASAAADAGAVPAPPGTVSFLANDIQAQRRPPVDVSKPLDVLGFVLSQAPEDITVYPTEGYYYFQFENGPSRVYGNFRFDLVDAAAGKLNFGYYMPATQTGEEPYYFGVLSKADGVELKTLSPFEFELTFRGRLTRVHIYDAHEELAMPKPLGPGESYVGPVFDDSGVQFELLFDDVRHAFLFVLNEGVPPSDTLTARSDHVEIGGRTGFAYYVDKARNRRILIGVSGDNVRSNSYFDGPFDQLPDRFVDPKRLQELIELAIPELKGKIGPRGEILESDHSRAMVAPYRIYESLDEFKLLDTCAVVEKDNHDLNDCLRKFAEQ